MGRDCIAQGRTLNLGWVAVLSAWVLAGCTFMVDLPGAPIEAFADGTEASPNGEIFRRKGWITPAIYKKQKKAEAETAQLKAKPAKSKAKPVTSGSNKSAVKVAGSGKSSSKLKTAAKARRVKTHRKASSGGVPKKVVKRREQKLKKTASGSGASSSVKVASLGGAALPEEVQAKHKSSVTGGSARIQWVANSRCVPGRLKAAIAYVARNFGRVRVNSTCRSRKHNRRVGGASQSWHLKGRAADIRVFGNIGKAARYLRRVVGGFKHYGGGLFHIDTGPRRSW